MTRSYKHDCLLKNCLDSLNNKDHKSHPVSNSPHGCSFQRERGDCTASFLRCQQPRLQPYNEDQHLCFLVLMSLVHVYYYRIIRGDTFFSFFYLNSHSLTNRTFSRETAKYVSAKDFIVFSHWNLQCQFVCTSFQPTAWRNALLPLLWRTQRWSMKMKTSR